MSTRRGTAKGVDPPKRETSPTVSLGSRHGGSHPVVVLDTPLANRFAGFSVVANELTTAGEMIGRIQSESDPLVVSALWRAGVAIYARCFASTGSGMPKLEESVHLQGVPSEIRAVHDRLMTMRHGFLSHAGYSENERSSAQAILNDLNDVPGVLALVASRAVTSVPPSVDVVNALRLIEAVQVNVQSSLLAAHGRALAEVRALPVHELYSKAQSL